MGNEELGKAIDTAIKLSHDAGYMKGYCKGLRNGVVGAIVVASVGKVAYEYYKKRKDKHSI